MRFAHLGDCHLGGWRQQELRDLNFKSFQIALEKCKKEKVDFILIAGDLFDSAYPPIETLKETFEEFKKVKEANIPVFLIAGSHDYSVSGKTFLDVLEKSGFCKNVSRFEERDGKIILEPTIYKNTAIYGFPGKKSGLEVDDIKKIKIHDSPGLFKILMLHTTIKDAIGNIPVKSVNHHNLPKVDYLALAHLHIHYQKENRVYCGPIFPNNLSELEELGHGTFCIYDNGSLTREKIELAKVLPIKIKINNALEGTELITKELKKHDVKNKIVVIRAQGIIETGKITDIDFQKIESYLKNQGAKIMLKSTSKLSVPESDIETKIRSSENMEQELISEFSQKNPSKFNQLIPSLIRSLMIEKLED
ncbi:MAG: exonuclease SbcCD subunit D, partial [Nanoarchaeota archaeon]|nr:exonuclease SbcCD subunit D [Nanoarchaeota archaeon]